jgi:DNA polymerase (family 10)
MRDRFHIAAALREIGRLLKLKGENPFKSQAYDRGASALEKLEVDFDALVKNRRLTGIGGIGNALAAVIEELYRTGESRILEQLRRELPAGAVELSAIPGLTLKKMLALHDALHIESIADLKTACEEGLVRRVKSFGEKAEAKILAAIQNLESRQQRTLLNHALEEAKRLLQYMRAAPELIRADIAGSLRRQKESVRHIRIVAASEQPQAVIDTFLGFPALVDTVEYDRDRCIGRLARGLQSELHVVPPGDYVLALHRLTGSKEHYAKLLERARLRGVSIDPTECGTAGKRLRVQTEADIYQTLGMQYVPPELRENAGEIEAAAAGTLPIPVTLDAIQGLVHCHTIYSDGQNSVEEMALAAEALGMKYLTITDHSPSAFYARGVNIDRLRAQWDEIARVQEKVKIKILKGTESDILGDGGLDYPDYILERFDIIIASIHTRNKMDADQMTKRLLRAMQWPLFKIWGHPLGRLLHSRPPFECRIEEVLDAVAASRAAVEINGDPRRLDLEPRWIRPARERGIKFVVSTDAHSTSSLGNLPYGIAMARRGWLTRDDVLNTLDTENFMKAVHP